MLVPEFCNYHSDNFDDDFYACLPTECPECGYPLEMTEVLTQLHCSNPRCPSKVAQRLVSIANAIGVKDLGESRAAKFVNHLGIDNPLLIFAYEPDADGQMADDISMDVSRKIAQQFAERNKFTLAEYIRVANLPGIQMSAFSIFDEWDDLESAYEAIEAGGVELIRDKLNIRESGTEDISIRALKAYDALMTFKDDLFQAIDYVNIVKIHTNDMITLRAVCSTEVGQGFKTKADFYATCNNLYPNIHIEFGNSVTKKTDYLVWAGGTAAITNKVKKARGYIEQGVPIKIVTALQFLEMLQNLAKDGM